MQNGNEHAMQPVPQHVGALSTEAQRSIEEVRASLTIAQQFPRDTRRAMKRIEAECSQLRLAESAEYSYKRDKVQVRGPSIRLLEVFMRHWGNIDAGWRELARWTDPKTGYEIAECEAYAWDMETNGRDRRRFSVLLARYYSDGGSKPLTDQRDQYEMVANYAQRRKRACLEAMVPQWAIDEARDLCRKTIQDKIIINSETVEEVVKAFAAVGVNKQQLEDYLEHPLTVSDFNRREYANLRGVYQAIRDGEAKASDFFPPVDAQPDAGQNEDLTRQFTEHANGNGNQQSPAEPEQPQPEAEAPQQDGQNGPPTEAELFGQVDQILANPAGYGMDAINELAALTDAVSGARREEYRRKLGEARKALFNHQRGSQAPKPEPKPADDGVQGAFFGD